MVKYSDNGDVPTIEAKLSAIATEIKSHQARILELRSEASVLTEALDVLNGIPSRSPLKTVADHIEEILRKEGKNLKIHSILEELEKRGVSSTIQNVSGLMSRYLRIGRRFSRPAPATYGLLNDGEE